MGTLPCAGYARAGFEKCEERRDNGYWKWDEWADEWGYKCPKWQPGKFFCTIPFFTGKVIFKTCYWLTYITCLFWQSAKALLCVLYVGSISPFLWLGRLCGFTIPVNTGPTSPFNPAIACGERMLDQQGSRPLIMCWTEPGDTKFGASGLRLKYEQLHHYSTPFHNVIPQFATKAVDGEVSHRGPALTCFNGTFFLAWTGRDKEHSIHVMQSPDGGDTWSSKVTLPVYSTSAPALGIFGNRIHVAWRDKPRHGSYLNIMSSADGITWENKTKLAVRAQTGPALANFGSLLFIAWSGKDDGKLNIRSSKDGRLFENEVTLAETTDTRPALCACDGYLYLSWKERSRAGVIQLIRSRNGFEWTRVLANPLPSAPLNVGKPALTAAEKSLVIGWADPQLHIAGKIY